MKTLQQLPPSELFQRVAALNGTPLPSSPSLRDFLTAALEAELGDAYDCTRVWSAWGYGTMSENDFRPVNNRLDEIVDGLLVTLAAAGVQSTPGEQPKGGA
jgi:hypothetical protein